MEESFKARLILILAILTAIFFIASVSSCAKIKSLKRLKDDEMLARLTCQEEIKSIKDGMIQNLKSREKDLEEEKKAHENTKRSLSQEQLLNQSLKEELAKVTRLKEALEEALVNCKKNKK